MNPNCTPFFTMHIYMIHSKAPFLYGSNMVVRIEIKCINAEIVICCVNISMARYAQTIFGDSLIGYPFCISNSYFYYIP